MHQHVVIAAAADSAPNPWLFVLGGAAVVIVSILGPLSRLHERRSRLREEAAAERLRAADAGARPEPDSQGDAVTQRDGGAPTDGTGPAQP